MNVFAPAVILKTILYLLLVTITIVSQDLFLKNGISILYIIMILSGMISTVLDERISNPKMPWFVKTLQETVSDSIELNVCSWTNNEEFKYVGVLLTLLNFTSNNL